LKILFLSSHLNTGGITSYLYVLVQGLIACGHTVYLGTSGGNMEKEFLALKAILIPVNIRTKSELSPKLYLALPQITKIIHDEQIDIIHAQTRITQVQGQLLKAMSGCGYVATCHGFYKPRISRKIFPCWGDRVIAISQPVVKHLVEDFSVGEEKIDLISSGIAVDDFAVTDEETKLKRRKLYNIGAEPVIGILARLSDVKGQDVLVEAMKDVVPVFPDVKLLLVGEGKLDPLLKKLVVKFGLKNNVIFFPVIKKIPEILSIFDVFVLPSRQEGLGISVMEAQAAGLPVIASNTGGIPSLIKDRDTGFLVPPEDVAALSAKIIMVLQNKEQSKEVGLKARRVAEEKYSSKLMTDKTIKTYRKVLEG